MSMPRTIWLHQKSPSPRVSRQETEKVGVRVLLIDICNGLLACFVSSDGLPHASTQRTFVPRPLSFCAYGAYRRAVSVESVSAWPRGLGKSPAILQAMYALALILDVILVPYRKARGWRVLPLGAAQHMDFEDLFRADGLERFMAKLPTTHDLDAERWAQRNGLVFGSARISERTSRQNRRDFLLPIVMLGGTVLILLVIEVFRRH
jgi:hypothetical protein